MFISSANISTGIEPRRRLAHQRVETVLAIAVLDGPNLPDLELRPVVRLPQHGPQLVETARRPFVAARIGQRRVGPDRETDLAPRIAKRDAEIRLAVASGELLLLREQREEIGLLAFSKFAEQRSHGARGMADSSVNKRRNRRFYDGIAAHSRRLRESVQKLRRYRQIGIRSRQTKASGVQHSRSVLQPPAATPASARPPARPSSICSCRRTSAIMGSPSLRRVRAACPQGSLRRPGLRAVKRPIDAHVVGEILFEPLDRFDDALRQILFAQNVVARVVRNLLRVVARGQVAPAALALFRASRCRRPCRAGSPCAAASRGR